MSLSRRSFLAFAITSVPFARGITVDMLRPIQKEALDDTLLLALANAVLPTELGASGMRAAAGQLQTWIREYVPGAERNHGYGSARIQNTGADPSPRWALQLRSLESDARASHNTAFAALGIPERRAVVRAQLGNANAIPGDVAGASHVALALLASFYSSYEATDLCYEAQIGRNTCRPLATSAQRPVALQRARGGA
jgi:hypothetical protein